MNFCLYILRHAKSDWSVDCPDFDRPLNKRGKMNARRMGRWLAENGLSPELVLCSPAARARQTLALVNKEVEGPNDYNVIFDPDLYMAGADTMLDKILAHKHGAKSLMLIAHNPGLDYLVGRLSRGDLQPDRGGKLMTTAALAIFEYNNSDFDPDIDKPSTLRLVRPKELD